LLLLGRKYFRGKSNRQQSHTMSSTGAETIPTRDCWIFDIVEFHDNVL
jgi:hypothetical protein